MSKFPRGKGSGTIRQNRWNYIKAIMGWVPCSHLCSICRKVWEHDILPDTICKQNMFRVCMECMLYPNGLNKGVKVK
jgi:hypothetical protein